MSTPPPSPQSQEDDVVWLPNQEAEEERQNLLAEAAEVEEFKLWKAAQEHKKQVEEERGVGVVGVCGGKVLSQEVMGPPAPRKRKAAAPETEKKKKLRINAKKLLITIARCQEDLQAVANAFENKWGICQYKIVKELHKDGFPHIHAGVKFEDAKQVTSNSLCIAGTVYMMNFNLVKKQAGGWKGWVYTYMEKDPIETLNTLKEGLNLMAAENEDELFSLLVEESGMRKAMMDWDRIVGCWEHFHKKKYVWTPTFALDSFKIPHYLAGLEVELTGVQTRRRVIILIGATRLGKTQMIRTMYHQSGHGYCRGRHNFKEWLTTSGPMVLDDLEDGQAGSTTKAPMKAWTDSQPFNMSGKYKKTTEMAPRQVFILTNDDPVWRRDAYWVSNTHTIWIKAKCFK